MVNEVPSEATLDAEVSVARTLFRIGKDPPDLSIFRTYCEGTPARTIRAGGCRLFQLPRFDRVVETITGDRAHWAGVHTLATKFALEGTVKICVNHSFDSSF